MYVYQKLYICGDPECEANLKNYQSMWRVCIDQSGRLKLTLITLTTCTLLCDFINTLAIVYWHYMNMHRVNSCDWTFVVVLSVSLYIVPETTHCKVCLPWRLWSSRKKDPGKKNLCQQQRDSRTIRRNSRTILALSGWLSSSQAHFDCSQKFLTALVVKLSDTS